MEVQCDSDKGHCLVKMSALDAEWTAFESTWHRIVTMLVSQGWPVLGSDTWRLEQGQSKRLTNRENQVARLVAEGKTKGEIASELVIAISTVETHARNIAIKWGLKQEPGERADWRSLSRQANLRRSQGEI